MQQLHLVGFTTDLEGLIFSARKGAKSGGYLVMLDDRLRATIEDALRLRNGEDDPGLDAGDGRSSAPRRPRPQSTLSPREIQARLRMGSSIAEIAEEAGVDEEWVGRFAAPILAEQAQVVARARRLAFVKPRLGESALPLGDAVRWNLADRDIRFLDDDFDAAWSAYNLQGASWVVRIQYASRGKRQSAEWEVDLREGELYARNRIASELAYVDATRRRRRPPVLEPSPRETPATPSARRDPSSGAGGSVAASEAAGPAASASAPRLPIQARPTRSGAADADENTRGGSAGRGRAATKTAGAKKRAATTGRATKQAGTKKAAVKKAAAKKAGGTKAAAKTGAVAKKGGPTRAAAAKAAAARAGTKKAATKSAATSKATAKKTAATKTAATKTAAKKTAARAGGRAVDRAAGRTGAARQPATANRRAVRKAAAPRQAAKAAGGRQAATAGRGRATNAAKKAEPDHRGDPRGRAADERVADTDLTARRSHLARPASPMKSANAAPPPGAVRPPVPSRPAPAARPAARPTARPAAPPVDEGFRVLEPTGDDGEVRLSPPRPAVPAAAEPPARREPPSFPQPQPRAQAAPQGRPAPDNGEAPRRRPATPPAAPQAPSQSPPARAPQSPPGSAAGADERLARRLAGRGNGGNARPARAASPSRAAAGHDPDQLWHGPGSGEPAPAVRIRADVAAATVRPDVDRPEPPADAAAAGGDRPRRRRERPLRAQ